MKPVFRCDYCEQMGTEKEISEHERECQKNPENRSCMSCANASGMTHIKCSLGKEIPAFNCIIHCVDYVPGGDPEHKTLKSFADIFGDPFGWGRFK